MTVCFTHSACESLRFCFSAAARRYHQHRSHETTTTKKNWQIHSCVISPYTKLGNINISSFSQFLVYSRIMLHFYQLLLSCVSLLHTPHTHMLAARYNINKSHKDQAHKYHPKNESRTCSQSLFPEAETDMFIPGQPKNVYMYYIEPNLALYKLMWRVVYLMIFIL